MAGASLAPRSLMASSASSSMSVSTRPTDEATSVDTSPDAEQSPVDRGPPVPSQLEETRDGGFAERPVSPVSLTQTMPYVAGDVIANKYRLTKVLGEGGMGAVWLARNLALEIDVAIKLIRHDYANAEGAMRLLQEARAAARIGHPCIVRVFDFGTTERADPFIVMEVLQGESLAQTIARKGRLSAISAVRTLLPVAGALAAAHAKGIVHRDLKPDNIRLVTDDRGAVIPKVVDFGIAKLHHDDIPRETTQAGVILGSPHYMSPEQACGRSDVDHRTDIWAFSVMLYEVIAGKRPFEGPNYNALISSILVFHPASWEEHDIREPELWALVQKGLAKEQQERWQSMQEYGEVLATWASKRDVETDAAGNSLRAHWLVASVQRPLSEFPPPNAGASEPVRARLISIPELDETNEDPVGRTPPAAPASADPAPSLAAPADPPPDLAPDDLAPGGPAPVDPAPAVVSPSSDPLATTNTKTAERWSPAIVIGALALTVGVLIAVVIMMATNREEPRPAAALSAVVENADKRNLPAPNLPPPTIVASSVDSATDPAPIVPLASVTPAVNPPASAHPSASPPPVSSPKAPPRPTTRPTTKPSSTPPLIPPDPNF